MSTSRHDLWNNGVAGLVAATVKVAGSFATTAGCKVDVVLADGYQHCGLFFFKKVLGCSTVVTATESCGRWSVS